MFSLAPDQTPGTPEYEATLGSKALKVYAEAYQAKTGHPWNDGLSETGRVMIEDQFVRAVNGSTSKPQSLKSVIDRFLGDRYASRCTPAFPLALLGKQWESWCRAPKPTMMDRINGKAPRRSLGIFDRMKLAGS